MRMIHKVLLVGLLILALAVRVGAQDETSDPVYIQESINANLAPLEPPANLETPQGTMEFFLRACEAGEFGRAAHALNLRLLPDASALEAALLAERLFFVINQELWIDWEALPDRPDGMDDSRPLNGSGSMVGQARKSLTLGSVEVDGRDSAIRLQRATTGAQGETPRWLISAFTVENIQAMYQAHGPGWLNERMPEWARVRAWGGVMVWQLITMLLTFLVVPFLAWAATWTLRWLLRKGHVQTFGVYDALHWPVTFFLATIMLSVVFSAGLSLPGYIAAWVDPIVLLSVAATGAWIAMRAMNYVVENIAKRAVRRSHDGDEETQQSILTSISVFRHVLILAIAAIALGIVLSQMSGFRSIGVALLSSAGALAIIAGIAGHAVLGNLIAGLQIAFTRPFTLGDWVYIEDNYGTIEDITYTYVIVRTWDYRRLVIPIRHFVDHWFENWSLRDPFLTKPIYLYVDYSASIEAIRKKFLELVKADDDWAGDRDEPAVLAYEAKEESLIVRLTCAAKDPGTAWGLHCRIREQMVTWLQEVEGGRWLPRQRIDLSRAEAKEQNASED